MRSVSCSCPAALSRLADTLSPVYTNPSVPSPDPDTHHLLFVSGSDSCMGLAEVGSHGPCVFMTGSLHGAQRPSGSSVR